MSHPANQPSTPLLNALAALEDKEAVELALTAEQLRREPPSFDTMPLVDGVPEADWAAYGLMVERAVHHLKESLPGGQAGRTVAAMRLLRLGLEGLERNLRRRNLRV